MSVSCSRALNFTEAARGPVFVECRIAEVASEIVSRLVSALGLPAPQRTLAAAHLPSCLASPARVADSALGCAELEETRNDVPSGRVAERLPCYGIHAVQRIEPGHTAWRRCESDERVGVRLAHTVRPRRISHSLPDTRSTSGCTRALASETR